jgi:hypothetical protein
MSRLRSKVERPRVAPEWETLKSGVRRHRDGEWYAGSYSTGWYFWDREQRHKMLGPFRSFEDGLKEWGKVAGK